MSESAYGIVLDSLFEARRGGVEFGTERIAAVLETLGLPHETAASIQVAGTNGKGSTCSFLSAILRHAGYRVGVFSSPHILSLCERFRIDGEAVSRSALARAHAAVSSASEGLPFFEQITAMAAWLFAEARVDVSIYEVGMGGRLDATTALPSSLSVVTGIALDHCEFLGDTLEAIAIEKAGIFRASVPAILGMGAPPDIRELLSKKHPETVLVGAEHLARVPEVLEMCGHHQRENAACALAAVDALRVSGLQIDSRCEREGLRSTRLTGRMEQVGEGLWLDGAHNPQAARALAASMADRAPWNLLVGISMGKDLRAFLRPLAPHCNRLVCTEFQGERANAASVIAECAAAVGYENVECEPILARALALVRDAPGPVLVTGSLLLLGDVLSALGVAGADPQLVTDPGPPIH